MSFFSIFSVIFLKIVVEITVNFIIELTHGKTILENTVEIEQ